MRSFATWCCSLLLLALALGLLALALGLPALSPGFGPGVALAQEPSQAQREQEQPYNNAPLWREVRSGEAQYTSIKGRETGVLMQPLGETWRKLRNGWIVPIAGWFILAFASALALLHWKRGPIKLRAKPTGRLIQRFTTVERVAHSTVAISFCVLAISGLIMMVGKSVLLPVIGYTLFSWLAQLAKLLHNFTGPVFIAGVVLLIVLFARHALPRAGDLVWLIKNRGGVATGAHVPCHFLNGGQKMWFWGGVVAMSLIVGVTGLVMDFPNFDQLRSTMIVANVLHASVGGILMGLSLFHIYMGSIGQEGAYEGMRYGYVDEVWAKEHHELWYEDVKAGKVKAGSAQGRPEAPQIVPG